MQLHRAVPLSLVALLASAGCVSVGPRDPAPEPARTSVPPVGAPADPSPGADALPLGRLPAAAPEPTAKAAPRPRHTRVPGPAGAGHPRRRPPAPPRTDEMCALADGSGVVPPSIVDLCLRQYGR
ncbi:hypothetical protein [Streptomyces sp. NPDC047014]|uniref:hypothetical protein n=1 Tax=Streptomyces sp. NPDC047014 TaxID=3155736 RepID=UPI0033C963CC